MADGRDAGGGRTGGMGIGGNAPPAPPAIEYSEALPMLTRRASLGPKGALVGDVGFDPLGFTEIFPLVRALLDEQLSSISFSLSSAATIGTASAPFARWLFLDPLPPRLAFFSW